MFRHEFLQNKKEKKTKVKVSEVAVLRRGQVARFKKHKRQRRNGKKVKKAPENMPKRTFFFFTISKRFII